LNKTLKLTLPVINLLHHLLNLWKQIKDVVHADQLSLIINDWVHAKRRWNAKWTFQSRRGSIKSEESMLSSW
jgi:hypothetical protein